MGTNIARIPGGPVGSCYPCKKVSDYPYHYFGTTKQASFVWLKNSSLHSLSLGQAVINLDLAWRCPGGASPPVNCPTRDFMQSEDGTSCVCKPGYYLINTTTCALCLKGHQCSKGILEKCPKHYHQPTEGQTECLKCAEPPQDNGFYSNCPMQGTLLKMCDPNVPGTQDKHQQDQCIPCNQCRRAFTFGSLQDANMNACYRDR